MDRAGGKSSNMKCQKRRHKQNETSSESVQAKWWKLSTVQTSAVLFSLGFWCVLYMRIDALWCIVSIEMCVSVFLLFFRALLLALSFRCSEKQRYLFFRFFSFPTLWTAALALWVFWRQCSASCVCVCVVFDCFLCPLSALCHVFLFHWDA